MIERIIDLSTDAVRLSVNMERLLIERHNSDSITMSAEPVTVPLDEVAAVVASHRQVVFTQPALAGIASHGGAVVVCDGKMMPVGMMLPIEQHHLQAERFVKQAEAALPVKKQIWRQIVQAKVAAQGRTLLDFRKSDFGFFEMAKRVKSGDTDNIEAQSARRYWPLLFDDPAFKREREAPDQNRFLNYGYTVLRAMVARAICATGLHPSLGVHHHNRYDAFCLADDLMEPFRPVVDRAVVHIVYSRGKEAPMDKETKAALIGAVTGRYRLDGESRTLFDILSRTAASLAKIFTGEGKELALPVI